MVEKELCVLRNNVTESTYIMQNHKRSQVNERRWSLIMSATNRINHDGLSNLKQVAKLLQVKEYHKFTHLRVNVTYGRLPSLF